MKYTKDSLFPGMIFGSHGNNYLITQVLEDGCNFHGVGKSDKGKYENYSIQIILDELNNRRWLIYNIYYEIY